MQPLEGIKVLDFTHALAGSACTNIMRRLGAEVIKVERPEVGDDLRHYTEHAGTPGLATPFCSVNAGKKSFTLDLGKPEAEDVVARLTRWADVVVENYRPGVPAKLKIDYDTLSAINPKIVYCTITGFGQNGPLRDWTAYDHIVQAASGIMFMNGESGAPMKVGLPAIDTFSGFVAAIGVLAALRRRDATGEGEYVDIAMLDAAMTLMASSIASYLHSGSTPQRLGNKGFRLVPTSGIYKTADGFVSIGANHQHQVEALFRVLKRADLAEDPRFATHTGRITNAEALHDLLSEELAKHDALDLEALLSTARIPVSKVRTVDEAAEMDHVAARRLYIDAHVPGRDSPMRLVRGAPLLAGADDDAGSVPILGEHNSEILELLGYSAEEMTSLSRTALV